MKEGKRRLFGRTLRWTWAIVAAVLFHLALFWGVVSTNQPDQLLRRQARQFTEIQYLNQGEADEVLTLFDPRPLLLPTRWNVSNASDLTDVLQEEGDIFPDFAPMFELEDGNYIDDFGNAAASYDRLSDAQVDFEAPLFREIGREEPRIDFEQEGSVSLALYGTEEGELLASYIIYSDEFEALSESWPEWRPTTMMAMVEKSFLVGGVAVLESSGFEEVDQRLRTLVRMYFPDFKQLEDGVYLLEVLP